MSAVFRVPSTKQREIADERVVLSLYEAAKLQTLRTYPSLTLAAALRNSVVG
jgi:hypothetical protein